MKHWQELDQILDRMLRLAQAGRSTALATVTRIQGSAYRRPGARLLIEDEGAVLGGVSGGCLEEDVRQVGLRTLQSGRSRLLHYETGDDDTKVWGLGLGCDGEVDIAVLPVTVEAAQGTWARVRGLLDGDAPFALSTVVGDAGHGHTVVVGESGRLAGDLEDDDADAEVDAAAVAALRARRSSLHPAGARTMFTEVLLPPPNLLVCGAGDDARPLVALAAAVGFRVFVVDHRSAHLTTQRFPHARRLLLLSPTRCSAELPSDGRTHAVVMDHSLKRDTEWWSGWSAPNVPYVGVLGPRARTERWLTDSGSANRERIFGPRRPRPRGGRAEQGSRSASGGLLAVVGRAVSRATFERAVAVHAF